MSNELQILKIVQKLDVKFTELFGRMEGKFAGLEKKFDYLDAKVTGMNADIGEMKLQISEINDKLDTVIGVVNDHETRIGTLHAAATA
jgi:hypothetical protein